MLYFCINHKNIAICVNQNITWNDTPTLKLPIGKMAFIAFFLKTKSRHISVNNNLCSRTGVGYTCLAKDWLYNATIEPCKAMKLVGGIRKQLVVHQYLMEQCYNTTTIHQVVHFVNGIVSNVGIVLVATGTRYAKRKHLHHRNPKSPCLGHLLCHTLFPLKWRHICFASSRLCFM